jgi:hypothetical protein
MTVTTGNFQDLVQLSQDTLYHLGPAFSLGDSAASTLTIGFSNSAGALALQAAQTGNETLWLPLGTVGTLLSNINISAGTTSANISAVTFSNANNVSFGFDGSNITASAAAGSGIAAVAGGTQTATNGTIVFSNSNNVSFGLSGSSQMTASVWINLSAGTTSNNLSAATFSNSNNVSFGLNGSVITASATVASTQGSFNVSAGTTSNLLSAITFSNSNGVSFGLNASTMTASVATSLTNIRVSAGTTSNLLSAITFSNSNGVSFGLNGSTLTASVASSLTGINVSAGTTSNNLSAVTFSNSNGIAFGLNGSVVTAALGGLSSYRVDGGPATALSMGNKSLYFEAIVVPYNITVTNLLWIASVQNSTSNVSGGISFSAALYSLNGGTAGSLSLASSGSTNLTWTSGAALSSFTGINYQEMTVNSWAVTPGPYLFAFWYSTQNSVTVSIYGPNPQPAIGSGQGAAMSNLMLNGLSQATTAGLPSSFGITNTASYIRTGATAAQQPYVVFQGT